MACYATECFATSSGWHCPRVRVGPGGVLPCVHLEWEPGQCKCYIHVPGDDCHVFCLPWKLASVPSVTSRCGVTRSANNAAASGASQQQSSVCRCGSCKCWHKYSGDSLCPTSIRHCHKTSGRCVTVFLCNLPLLKLVCGNMQVAMDVLGVMITCATCDFIFLRFMDSV